MEIKHAPDMFKDYIVNDHTTLRLFIYDYPTREKPQTLAIRDMTASDEWRIIFQCYSLDLAYKFLEIYKKTIKKG